MIIYLLDMTSVYKNLNSLDTNKANSIMNKIEDRELITINNYKRSDRIRDNI